MEKGKVDIELIKRYIRGELSPREMYALERRAQEDSAWMDVILGMEGEAQDLHAANLVDIRRRIAARTARGRLRRLTPAQRWAVAATVLLALSFGTLWFTQWRSFEQKPGIASVPVDTDEQHLESYALPRSSDEAASKEAETMQSPQPEASATDETGAQNQKRLAMRTEKQEQLMDTADEVVVVGYGTLRKAELTGAVAKAEPLGESATARVQTEKIDTPVGINARVLVGRVAGVQAPYASGNAATDTPAPIRIRGVSPNAKADTIKGKVVDSETQRPLRGVSVQLAENRWVTTDSSGRFTIAGPSSMLNASLVGYELQTIKIAEKDSIILVMGPALASLDEVVVVGYGNENSRTGQPEPLTGWRKYKRYLKKGVKQTEGLKGDVTLTFMIDAEGSPTDIQITYTTDTALGEKVAELVREGPKWKPGKNGEQKAELQLEF